MLQLSFHFDLTCRSHFLLFFPRLSLRTPQRRGLRQGTVSPVTAGCVLLTSGRALLAHEFLDKSLLFLKDIIKFYFVYIIRFFIVSETIF